MMIAVAMVAGAMTGCGGSSKSEGKIVNTNTGNFNEFGWEMPEETLVINIMEAVGNDAPSEAEKLGRENMKAYYKENFNVEINMEYATGDGVEALNLALASNKYPDIIKNATRDMTQKFIDMGKTVELTPYMDTIGKDLKTSMGDLYPLFLNDELKLHYVPTLMGSLKELPDTTAHLRYDEYQAIGSPPIETPEDYYNALNAILELNPTNPAGEKRYAISFYTDPGHYTDPNILSGFWGLKKGYDIDSANNFTHWAFTEEGKEMVKYFNQFHLDGTLDPDSFSNNFEQWKTKFSNERIAGAVGFWWTTYKAGHEVWQVTDPNVPEDKRYVHYSFKDPEAEAANVSHKNSLGSRCTFITDKAADPEALLKFINFQATERGGALTTWGIPNGTPIGDTGETGKLWNIDKEGNWSVDPVAKEQLINETWDYDTEGNWTDSSLWLFANQTRWPDGVHNMWPNQMWYEENKWKSMMIENLDGTIYDSSAMELLEKDSEVQMLEQSILDAWRTNWGDAVRANNDAEFDASWKKLQDALTAAGIEKYEEILKANYEKNLAKIASYQ